MNTYKNKLRTQYKAVRKNICGKRQKDDDIYRSLISMPEYKKADKIMFYLSLPDEPDTKKMIDYAFLTGKKVFVPKVINKTDMAVCQITPDEHFVKSGLGINEPSAPVYVSGEKMDLIVVPGIAFDECGTRLGFGGGYYDRFLARLSCTTVGLCYEDCLVKRLIREKTDIGVKYVITEKRIVNCGG